MNLAARGTLIARLAKRGLPECCARGRRRLTRAGLALARRLTLQITPPTKRELAYIIDLHKGIRSVVDKHPPLYGKRCGLTKAPLLLQSISGDFERVRPGIEVKLDLSGL